MSSSRTVRIEVQHGDALKTQSDVLALKYAQELYGLDSAVYGRLSSRGRAPRLPEPGEVAMASTGGFLGPDQVLFVGVPPLNRFGYRQIREFGRQVLSALAGEAPGMRRLALTIHGPGYGLDEEEAFESQLAGLLDAIDAGDHPPGLAAISFIEKNAGRAERLKKVLADLLPRGEVGGRSRSRGLESRDEEPRDLLRTVGYASADKPHVFVAMPFVDSMEDVFHYGIQGAVKAAGYLCERADLTSFVGDVVAWVRQRIANASFVIADLTTANPNVYLEVGYAWGCGRPTVLIVRDATELKFDVKGQRCLVYKSIKHLEEILSQELKALTAPLS